MSPRFFSKYSLLFYKNKMNINQVLYASFLSLGLFAFNQSANASTQTLGDYNALKHSTNMSNKKPLFSGGDSTTPQKSLGYSANSKKVSEHTFFTGDDALQEFLLSRNIITLKDIQNAEKTLPPLPKLSKNNPSLDVRQEKIVSHITDKYKNINRKTAESIVKNAYVKANKYDIDPVVLIAIAGVESNYNPKIVNKLGASGLTQVVKKYHRDKIRKINAQGGNILNISDNLDVGAQIYSDLYHKYKNHTTALQAYNGSLNDKKKSYSKRVMRELSELRVSMRT